MAVERSLRINELVKRIFSTILQQEYANTNVGWITVSRVVVSKDLQHARVFFTVLGDDEKEAQVLKKLKKDRAHLRFLLGRNIILRYIPDLIFHVDQELKDAMKVDKMIDDADITPEEDDDYLD